MSLSARCAEAWQALSPRDRRVLALALPVIVVLVLYLAVVVPLQQRRAAAWAEVAQYREAYHWLREQPPAAGAACGAETATESAPAARLREQLAASGLADAIVTAAGDGQWDITIAAAPGQPVLQFVDAMACGGFAPLAVSLQPVADAPDRLAADISLLAPGGG